MNNRAGGDNSKCWHLTEKQQESRFSDILRYIAKKTLGVDKATATRLLSPLREARDRLGINKRFELRSNEGIGLDKGLLEEQHKYSGHEGHYCRDEAMRTEKLDHLLGKDA